jgi:hypothetical protein
MKKSKIWNMRLSEKDKKKMQKLADKHMNGNLSAWIKSRAIKDN